MNKFLWVTALLLPVYSMAANVDKVTKQEIKWLLSNTDIAAVACDIFETRGTTLDKQKKVKITPSIFKENKLNSNSKNHCLISDDYSTSSHKLDSKEYFFVDDINVEIFHSDGSGIVGKEYSDSKTWLTACKTDAMTDEYTCAIMKDDLVIIKSKDGYKVVVGTKHFPGKTALIRLDKNKPIESNEKGQYSHQQSAQLINDMANAKTVTTRFIQWPYEKYVDSTMDMTNFNVAKKVLDLIYEKHN